PDVRSVNPGVPADLAAIVLKLMAKDRDRRYQTPEQLARDLLILAGALGLHSVSPEGLVWTASGRGRAWERHLVSALPAAALALVVAARVWWGQSGDAPLAPIAAEPILPSPPAPRPGAEGVAKARPAPRDRPAAAPAAGAPREVVLKAGDDLA